MSDKYIGHEVKGEIGGRLKSIVEDYFRYYTSSGIFRKQLSAHNNYYGRGDSGRTSSSEILAGGNEGQLRMVKVNHVRNMGLHLLQLTTSQKPAPQPIATNSDARSQKQVVLAKGILEYYNREKRVGDVLRRAAECAILYSEGFVKSEWDAKIGDPVGRDETGEIRTTGDIRVSCVMPTDIIRDYTSPSFEDSDWVIVRNWVNKYDVAAFFGYLPGMEVDKFEIVRNILGQRTKPQYGSNALHLGQNINSSAGTDGRSDLIAVYEFFHRKSPSVPAGRYVKFLEDGTLLSDQELQYREIPVRRIAPGVIHGSPFCYTPIFDLLGVQKAIDALYSAVLTNQLTFGVQAIMAMRGSDLDFRMLSQGLGVIEYTLPDHKPESVNFVETAPEIFKFIEQLEGAMETISGVNSVVRGNPEASLKSGSALALVQSQAISFSSGLQESYAKLIEDVFTDILNIIKVYSRDPRTITLAGKFNRGYMREFVGESIADINRVVVNSGSALEQTLSGRVEIARDMLQNQLIKRPEEYLSVLTSGRLDPMLEGDNAELLLIRMENEAMADGKPVHGVPTDEHALHIKEHRVVLSLPESRDNPELLKVVSDHISEHVRFLATPDLAPMFSVLGQTPLQMAMAPEPGQGYAPGQAPQDAEKKGEGPKDFPSLTGPMPQPNFPINPETGLRWDPQTGGGAVIPDSAAGEKIAPGDKMPLPGDGVFSGK